MSLWLWQASYFFSTDLYYFNSTIHVCGPLFVLPLSPIPSEIQKALNLQEIEPSIKFASLMMSDLKRICLVARWVCILLSKWHFSLHGKISILVIDKQPWMTSVSWICDMFGWFVWEILSIDNHLTCLRENFGVYVVNLKKNLSNYRHMYHICRVILSEVITKIFFISYDRFKSVYLHHQCKGLS